MTPKLEAAYREPHRRYHDLSHIHACLALLEGCDDLGDRERRLLTWAVWWHDAIYDPSAADNEERSAELAETDLAELGASAEDRAEVARLIRLTAGHEAPEGDRLGARLVSIDLAILGADPAHYEAYAQAVRQEYDHVPEPLWRTGRARVLQRFLDSAVIFPDPAFRARFEAKARENLARELAALS